MQVWTFAPWVQDELDAVMEELASMPKPTMGFHIRGGDKLSEDVQLVRHWGSALSCQSSLHTAGLVVRRSPLPCAAGGLQRFAALQARMTTRPQDHIDTFRTAYPRAKVS